jgi:hypothetical protein
MRKEGGSDQQTGRCLGFALHRKHRQRIRTAARSLDTGRATRRARRGGRVNAVPEVERARQVLATMIDLSMMSRREVARRMAERGVSVDLGRVLKGRNRSTAGSGGCRQRDS